MTTKPVLFLAFANDQARTLRNLAKEAHQLQELLDTKLGSEFEVVVRQNVGLKQILDLFQDARYRNRIALFHYGGHATSYELLLEHSEGSEAVDAVWFARFLAQQRGLALVFLNACSTEEHANALLDAGVGCVIATSQDIPDEVASEFALRFYTGLVGNASIQAASSEAVSAIAATQGEQAAAWWQLHPNPTQPAAAEWKLHNTVNDWLFGLPALPAFDLPDEPYRYLSWYDHAQAELFFGRSHEIRTLFDKITEADSSPIILLYGQSGVGKSSLLAAGLLPRLEQIHMVRYVRRDAERGLLAALIDGIRGFGEIGKSGEGATGDWEIEGLRERWAGQEEKSNQPLTVIIDQVEEVFTQGKSGIVDEMPQFLTALKAIFAKKDGRPQGKLVLGFRKEWYAEIKDLLKDQRLPHVEEFLKPLDRESVIEVVLGPARSARLQKHYGLHVDELLPSVLADDLLEDRQSPVAPTLQTLLSKLWRRAKEQSNSQPKFTLDLYQSLKREGILLGDFLDQQLQELRTWQASAVDSGLQLDLLAAHTSERGTAAQRTLEELLTLYAGERAGVPFAELVQQNRDKRLLVDPSGDGNTETTHATRLVHDTLAPLVRERHEKSDKPGQRARRILENRAVDWHDGETGAVLDEADLKIVEAGQAGMRAWNSDEVRLIEASRQARAARQRSRQQLRFAAIAAIAAVALFAVLAAWQWRLSQRRGDTIAVQATSGAQQGATVVALATQAEAQKTQLQAQATQEAKLRQTANQRLDQALINESKRLANLSLQQLSIDPVASVHLALAALPSQEITRPYVAEAEFALAQAVQRVQETAFLSATLMSAENQVAIGKDVTGNDKIAIGGFGGVRVANLDLSDAQWLGGLTISGSASIGPDGFVQNFMGEYVSFVGWSANGDLLATVGSKLYSWRGNELIADYEFDSQQPILCATWNPQTAVVALCAGASAYVWSPDQADSPTLVAADIFNQSLYGSHEISWSPDGRWLVAIGSGMVLWDAQTKQVAIEDRYESLRSFYAWSPDSQHFVTNSYLENALRLWPVSRPTDAVSLEHEGSSIGAHFVQLSDTIQLLSYATDGKFLLWDMTGKQTGEINKNRGIQLRQGILSSDGQKRATLADALWTIEISDATTGEIEKSFKNESSVATMAWHPSIARYLAFADSQGLVHLWDIDYDAPFSRLLGVPSGHGVERLVWIDGQHLLAYNNTGARVWQVFDADGFLTCENADPVAQCKGQAFRISDQTHINPRFVHFKGRNAAVYLWSNNAAYAQLNQAGRLKQSYALLGGGEKLWMFVWSPDGRQLLRFENFGKGEIWQLGLQQWSMIGELDASFGPATVWLDAGIVEAPGDGRLFDPQTGERFDLPVEGTLFWAKQWKPGVIFFGDSKGVTIWDLENQQVIQTFPSPDQTQSKDGWAAPDQHSLLINYRDGESNGSALWDIGSGEQRWWFPLNAFEAGPATLNHDGHFAGMASSDGIAIWHAEPSGTPIRTPFWTDTSAGYTKFIWSKIDNRFLTESIGEGAEVVIWRWNPETRKPDRLDRIPFLICDQCDVNNGFVNDDFSQLLIKDNEDIARSWHLWRNTEELVEHAKTCCLPRPLSEEQQIEFGVE